MTNDRTVTSRADTLLRVLVVDDNIDSADSMGEVICLWGHHVRVAYNAADALAFAYSFSPDVILLDLGMPRIDGLALARTIRQEKSMKNILLFAVTGYADDTHRQLAKEVGIDHYLVKPTEPELLEILLRNVLKVMKIARNAGRETLGRHIVDTVEIKPADKPPQDPGDNPPKDRLE